MSKASLKKRALEIIKRLDREYPDAKCHLEFKSPFELLISTVLAAQCTDVLVNKVMMPLYNSKYKSPKAILDYGADEFRDKIRSINFYNNKTKSIISICKNLVEKHKGKVPSTMEELTALPGVGRKSASVVLGNCFGVTDVIIVDTHLKRVSARLGLTKSDDPVKIEFELKELIPSGKQFYFSMRIGEHGRLICKAKNPKCDECVLNDICPSAFSF